MKRRYRNRERQTGKAEINIVPLLDVLLVLLLVFMATTPIINQSVTVDLPQAVKSNTIIPTKENKPVILEVTGVGHYALLIDNQRNENLSSEEIVAQAQQRLAAKPDSIFLVGGAKDVPYEEVINALNMLQKAGVASVGLMTKPI